MVAQLVAELRLVGPVGVAELDWQVHHLRFDLVVEGIFAKSFLSLRIHLINSSDYYLTCTALLLAYKRSNCRSQYLYIATEEVRLARLRRK